MAIQPRIFDEYIRYFHITFNQNALCQETNELPSSLAKPESAANMTQKLADN